MSLYAGSAEHYAVGRVAYPPELATALRDELGLDGTGRLLDVGCGPGSLTALLAPHFAEAVGIDADEGMLEVARRAHPGITWRHLRAEELPADLEPIDVVTFAQSFHWMDQPVVAATMRGLLRPSGAWVHVAALTHRGVDGTDDLPHPRPPWAEIDRLVVAHVGPERPPGWQRSGEEDVMRAAGYRGPTRLTVERGDVVERTADDVTAAVLSLSTSSPGRLGVRLPAFLADLRVLLAAASPSGRFSERLRDVEAVVWRPGDP